MLAKLTIPAVPEVRAVASMVGADRGDRKEELVSDSGATFHMSHTRAGMPAYKKASPGTNVEIEDGNILPVDGVEMAPNQVMGEVVLDGGGYFIPAGIFDLHTLCFLLSSWVAHDRAKEDTHKHTRKEHQIL